MHLKNEEETRNAIEKWRSFSPAGQAVNLRKAIEATELDHMYYDQKGSERGVERCEACLALRKDRLAEISE
ncbi:MAG: hypothetical protein ABFQ82_04820 [Thermodesulfobacteriota bacterium]